MTDRDVNKDAVVIGYSIHAISQSLIYLFIPYTRYEFFHTNPEFLVDVVSPGEGK
jgi:hypothetical protein